jgi:hypothetical protein
MSGSIRAVAIATACVAAVLAWNVGAQEKDDAAKGIEA